MRSSGLSDEEDTQAQLIYGSEGRPAMDARSPRGHRRKYTEAWIGAGAAIVAAVIAGLLAQGTGVISVAVGSMPTTTVTVTPPTATVTMTASANPGPATLGRSPGAAYLAEREPVLALPVSPQVGPATISGREYPLSVTMACGSTSPSAAKTEVTWNAARFTTLRATFGMDDDDPRAVGMAANVSVVNQSGHAIHAPFQVSVGSPRDLEIDLDGAVAVKIICKYEWLTSSQSTTNLVLGDAVFS
jgi:hypothetical protein